MSSDNTSFIVVSGWKIFGKSVDCLLDCGLFCSPIAPYAHCPVCLLFHWPTPIALYAYPSLHFSIVGLALIKDQENCFLTKVQF